MPGERSRMWMFVSVTMNGAPRLIDRIDVLFFTAEPGTQVWM